jgi:hypothetical protein
VRHPNLKQFGPQFSGHEKPIALRVIRNAVQYRIWIRWFVHQPTQVDPPRHPSGPGRDPDDPIRLSDIGINLATYILKFIQVLDRSFFIRDRDAPHYAKRTRIEKAQH